MKNVFPGAVVHNYTVYSGYPYSSNPRRIDPTILAVVHTTETSSVPYPGPGKSWTFSVERNGTVHQFLDPQANAPWTNGDKQDWDKTNSLVVAAANGSYNFNEYCFITIENVNRIFAGERLTPEQLEANRQIIQWGSTLSGLPVDRKHIIGHYQVNGNTRINCPTVPTDRNRVFDAVTAQLPDTSVPEETMVVVTVEPFASHVRWNVKAGTKLTGYDPKAGAVKSLTFSADSGANASGFHTVVQETQRAPQGRLLKVEDGYFAGLLIDPALVSLDPIPNDFEDGRTKGVKEGADLVKSAAVKAARAVGA